MDRGGGHLPPPLPLEMLYSVFVHPWTPPGNFRLRPLICLPLEKILQAPMQRGDGFIDQLNGRTC